jgi:hypothetical protein
VSDISLLTLIKSLRSSKLRGFPRRKSFKERLTVTTALYLANRAWRLAAAAMDKFEKDMKEA